MLRWNPGRIFLTGERDVIWIATFKAMMGLGLIINITKKASSGGAPPAGLPEGSFYQIIFG